MIELFILPVAANIGTYNNMEIEASYFVLYMNEYFYFDLIIESYCVIVPFEML